MTGSRRVMLLVLGGFVVLATVLHLWAGYTAPRPWPDESHFIAPALALTRGDGLAVPELNAPEGIFWMPAGYYVAQAPLLLLGVDPLVGGRVLSLAGVVAFAMALAVTAARIGVPRPVAFAAPALWLCLPRVVTIANIARMEGVILALAGIAVWLISRDRWGLAAATAWLAPLVHPIGLVVAVAVTGAVVIRTDRRPRLRIDAIAIGVVTALWVAQIVYFAANADATTAHLGFQFTRKAGRAITLHWLHWLLLSATGAAGLVATVRWASKGTPALRALWALLALSGAFVLVDIVGREMWYEFLGRETALLLAALATAAAIRRTIVRAPAARRQDRETQVRIVTVVATVLLVAGSAVAVRQTLTSSWYGMRGGWSSQDEWRVFTDSAIGELQRLDSQGGPSETVVIDPLSGFGQEVFARDWRRLTFVQPTPATPLPATSGDYVLATPGAPFATRELVAAWGSPAPALEVRTPGGSYSLQLFRRPETG